MDDTDGKILDSEKGLSLVDNDGELYRLLLDTFLSDAKFDPESFGKLVSAGNRDGAASYIHALKGAGRQIGAERLAAAGQRLEDVLRGKAGGNVAALAEKVLTEYALASEAVRNFRL